MRQASQGTITWPKRFVSGKTTPAWMRVWFWRLLRSIVADMKFNYLAGTLLLLTLLSVGLHGQQTEADRHLFDQIKAKAEEGDAIAQATLGELYGTGKVGVTKDAGDALKWYRKAAQQGVAEAQYNLGVCYDKGLGVEKDAVEAVNWYRKAADQDHAMAQFNIGSCYR